MRYGIVAIVVAVCGAGAYWYYGSSAAPSDGGHGGDVGQALRTPPAGYTEYRSHEYRFSLFYPSTLSVQEFDEGEGAATITFQNVGDAQGFQIFVTPYGLPQVSVERLKKDIPSGVRENLRDISVDGSTAASFFSRNDLIGETAEIWFIHEGYLYEVTTLKPLAEWLSGIMATWQFL
jgi:hypothetical protein